MERFSSRSSCVDPVVVSGAVDGVCGASQRGTAMFGEAAGFVSQLGTASTGEAAVLCCCAVGVCDSFSQRGTALTREAAVLVW
jgi:hypothetical protein